MRMRRVWWSHKVERLQTERINKEKKPLLHLRVKHRTLHTLSPPSSSSPPTNWETCNLFHSTARSHPAGEINRQRAKTKKKKKHQKWTASICCDSSVLTSDSLSHFSSLDPSLPPSVSPFSSLSSSLSPPDPLPCLLLNRMSLHCFYGTVSEQSQSAGSCGANVWGQIPHSQAQ